MTDWPTPPDAGTTWLTVRPRHGEPTLVRWARLWGRPVQIDAEGKVLCPYCYEMTTVDELSALDNSHPVGIVRRDGTTLPMAPDDPAPRRRSAMDEGF